MPPIVRSVDEESLHAGGRRVFGGHFAGMVAGADEVAAGDHSEAEGSLGRRFRRTLRETGNVRRSSELQQLEGLAERRHVTVDDPPITIQPRIVPVRT